MTPFSPSILIVGRHPKSLDESLFAVLESINHPLSGNDPDLYVIDENTGWGIDIVRNLRSFFSQKPFNHDSKIALIRSADNLNTEAQNSLLKVLEEPGNDNYVILLTSKLQAILPTVISRCQVIKTGEDNSTPVPDAPRLVPTGKLASDLALSEKYAGDKASTLAFLEEELLVYKNLLLKNPSTSTAKFIQKLIKAIQMLKSNVDPKSVLDFVLLS